MFYESKKREIEEKIIKIVTENFGDGVQKSKESFCIENYVINSVDALELLILIEKEFSIEIDNGDLSSDLVKDLSVLVEYVLNTMLNIANRE